MSRMPQVMAQELASFLRRRGFVVDRQSGSHLTLFQGSTGVSVTIPVHSGRDLGRGLAIALLKQAGFTVDDYLRLR